MKEINWEEFAVKYSFSNDHVHLACVICQGYKGVDPIVLCENTEIPDRHTKKFPGTRFDPKYLKKGFLTQAIEKELLSFDFDKTQYKHWLSFYKHQDDEILKSNNGDFKKTEYLFFFKKALVLAVLEKTGLFVELCEKPFYIDEDENENNPELKAYRIFFEAKSFTRAPHNNQKFFNLYKKSVKFLNAIEYTQIADAVKKRLYPKSKLRKGLLLSYWTPLFRYIIKGL
ncbi:MAG: hypothetical protein QG594_2183 [Bacteroidota bacterium]|jgi:hypothetical protein|nr:hypothetical protein [Bacteroidota bacterium]